MSRMDITIIGLFSLCVFVVIYIWNERVIQFAYDKSFGAREEILEVMDRMLIDTDKKKVTILLYLLSFGLGVVFFLLFFPNIIMGLLTGIAAVFIGWTVPKKLMYSLWEKRCDKIVNQMVDGMTIMANGVKSGLSVGQSLERVVVNVGGPLGQEFNLVINKTKLGMSLEEALNEFSERIPKDDVQMFVVSINILKETGGNLAETFVTINNTIRERQKIQRKIEALTASSMMQGTIITLIPFALMGVFTAMDPDYVKPLFTKPLGWFALVMMLGLQVIGGLMMRKLVKIEV